MIRRCGIGNFIRFNYLFRSMDGQTQSLSEVIWTTLLSPYDFKSCHFSFGLHSHHRAVSLLTSILIAFRGPSSRLSFRPPALVSVGFSSLVTDSLDDQQPLYLIDKSYLFLILKTAVEGKNSDRAWRALQKLRKVGAHLPERAVVQDLLLLLAEGDGESLLRAHKLVSLLQKEERNDLLDLDTLSVLALAFAKAEMFDLSANSLRLMVTKHFFPTSTFWKSVMEYWVQKQAGAEYVIKVFLEICLYVTKRLPSAQLCNEPNGMLQQLKPDKEAFNIALKACATLGNSRKAEEIIGQMRCFALTPDNVSFFSLIKAHENGPAHDKGRTIKQLKQILTRMTEAHVIPNHTTIHGLVLAYVTVGEIDMGAQLVLSWGGKGLCSEGDIGTLEDEVGPVGDTMGHDLVELDILMREWRRALGSPCVETCTVVLKSFLEKGNVADAAKFLAKLYHAKDSMYVMCSPAIDALFRVGLRDETKNVLQELVAQKMPADSTAYVMLINAYCKLPQPLKGEAVLNDAKRAGHLLGIDCYKSLIEAYNILQDYDCAVRVFRDMKKDGVSSLESTFNKLLVVFETNAKPYSIRKLLDVALHDPPMKIELYHWNVAVQSFCKSKLMFDAKAVVKRMKATGFHPDSTTYVFLLSGYMLQGGKTNEILLLWAEIKENLAPKCNGVSFRLTEELLNGFLTYFVNYGYFKNALDVIAGMEERNIWTDKPKLRNIYLRLHRHLYTSRHRSQRRVDMSQERRKQVQEFKIWVGLQP